MSNNWIGVKSVSIWRWAQPLSHFLSNQSCFLLNRWMYVWKTPTYSIIGTRSRMGVLASGWSRFGLFLIVHKISWSHVVPVFRKPATTTSSSFHWRHDCAAFTLAWHFMSRECHACFSYRVAVLSWMYSWQPCHIYWQAIPEYIFI